MSNSNIEQASNTRLVTESVDWALFVKAIRFNQHGHVVINDSEGPLLAGYIVLSELRENVLVGRFRGLRSLSPLRLEFGTSEKSAHVVFEESGRGSANDVYEDVLGYRRSGCNEPLFTFHVWGKLNVLRGVNGDIRPIISTSDGALSAVPIQHGDCQDFAGAISVTQIRRLRLGQPKRERRFFEVRRDRRWLEVEAQELAWLTVRGVSCS